MKIIHDKIFDINEKLEVQQHPNGMLIVDNLYKDIDQINDYVCNIPFLLKESRILRTANYTFDWPLYQLSTILSEIVSKKVEIHLDVYWVSVKSKTKVKAYTPTFAINESTNRVTIFLNETEGTDFMRFKKSGLYSSDDKFGIYYYEQVVRDKIWEDQWEEPIRIKGKKNRMLIYPSTMFAFPNLDIELDRYTQEYVI